MFWSARVTAAPDPVRGQVVKASIVLVQGTDGTRRIEKRNPAVCQDPHRAV